MLFHIWVFKHMIGTLDQATDKDVGLVAPDRGTPLPTALQGWV